MCVKICKGYIENVLYVCNIIVLLPDAYFVDMSYDGIDKRVDERMFAPENIAKLKESFEKCFTNGLIHVNGTHTIEHIAIR